MSNTPTSHDAKILRELLAKLRHDKKIQQNELAKILNKPQSFISKYETGERRLEFSEVIKICYALSIEPELFVREYLNLIKLNNSFEIKWIK